jgi:hypothetical protein
VSVRVEVFLACDVWRTSACAGRASLVVAVDEVAQGEARLQRRAGEQGWSLERGAGGGVLDACPAGASARCAAEVAGVAPPPPRPEYRLPATIREAAERTRRRREAAEAPAGPHARSEGAQTGAAPTEGISLVVQALTLSRCSATSTCTTGRRRGRDRYRPLAPGPPPSSTRLTNPSAWRLRARGTQTRRSRGGVPRSPGRNPATARRNRSW